MNEEQKIGMQTAVNAIIERFDDLEDETGMNFLYAKKVIIKWAKKNELFLENNY